MLLLCTTVFFWGLQYKLSLYEAPPSHQIPAAKLLTGKTAATLTAKLDAPKTRQPTTLFFLLLGAILLALSPSATGFLRNTPRRACKSPARAALIRFSFRPPPHRA